MTSADSNIANDRPDIGNNRRIRPIGLLSFVLVASLGLQDAIAAEIGSAGDRRPYSSAPTRAGEGRSRDDLADAVSAVAAADAAPTADEPVTFQDILREPNNVRLNVAYAQQQIRQGKLNQASVTLERALLVAPSLSDVRLLYATVLYRIGAYREAQVQIDQVEDTKLTDAQQAVYEQYVVLIERRASDTGVFLTVTAGGRYESNRNRAPSTGTVVFGDQVFDLPNNVGENDDFAFVTTQQLAVRHDLGTQEGHEVFGRITHFFNEQSQENTFDSQVISAEVGGIYRPSSFEIEPTLFGGYYRLSDQSFLRTAGAAVTLRQLFEVDELGYQVYLTGRAAAEDFDALREAPTTSSQTGPRYDLTLGGRGQFSRRFIVEAGLGVTDKHASPQFDYLGVNAFAKAVYALGGGHFLSADARAEIRNYDGPDPVISSRTRRDRNLLGSVGYVFPLFWPFDQDRLPDWIQDIQGLVGVGYETNNSNIENFEYKNISTSLQVRKVIEF